ncbi:ParB/Srx family N-terminal domain-containing protein [Halalkalibacter lacteus]|uniref:ParB/Srx family N-terminal domain-containing protein n=1 Tax=Halalkalibacter lacteus TaxID=3090663 RepID=UPI002FCA52AA
MAFDYTNLKEYSLDIDELRNYFYKHYRLNFKYFDQWIDGWIKVFKNAEKDTAIQINNLKKTGFPDFEVYRQNVHFGRVTFKFNFIIEGAKDYVKNSNIKQKKIKANQFSEQIKWSKESGTTTHDINNPIFLTTLPMEDYMYVVIDGNHRLTKLLAKGATEVSCIDIHPMEIINHNILMFTIDKAIYAFMVEHKAFQQHLNLNIHPHEALFNSSNINNAFKKMNVG